MNTLVFKDRGWIVTTTSWTAAAKPNGALVLCYLWGADGISWFDSATGVAQIEIDMKIGDFISLCNSGSNIVDLRPYQRD